MEARIFEDSGYFLQRIQCPVFFLHVPDFSTTSTVFQSPKLGAL